MKVGADRRGEGATLPDIACWFGQLTGTVRRLGRSCRECARLGRGDGGSAMTRSRHPVGRAAAAATALLAAGLALAIAAGPAGAGGHSGRPGQRVAAGMWLIETNAGAARGPGPPPRSAPRAQALA